MQRHPFPPLYDKNSKILILGSFPSVKSREQRFFYAHPQNRFWKVIASVFDSPVPCTVSEKKAFCRKNHIALWDVIASCEIALSSDSSIKNITANDLGKIFEHAQIDTIFVNGKTAEKAYNEYILPYNNRRAIYLPSTSPANAAWKLERLKAEWSRAIKKELRL